MDLPRISTAHAGKRGSVAPKSLFASSKNVTPQVSARGEKSLVNFHPHRGSMLPKNPLSHETTPPNTYLSHQHLAADESLFLGMEERTDWKDKVKSITDRQAGWLQRFANDIDESIIAIPKLTKTQLREKRIKDSGWTNIAIDKVVIPHPLPTVTVDDMSNFNPTTEDLLDDFPDKPSRTVDPHSPLSHQSPVRPKTSLARIPSSGPTSMTTTVVKMHSAVTAKHSKVLTKYCYICLQAVPLGPDLVNCLKCPLIVHLSCMPTKEPFLKQPRDPASPRRTKPETPASATNKAPPMGSATRVVSFKLGLDELKAETKAIKAKSGGSPHSPHRKSLPNSDTPSAFTPAGGSAAASPTKKPPTTLKLVKSRQLGEHACLDSVVLTDETTAADLEWICPFCHNDVAFYNTYVHNKHNNELVRMVQLSNCIKLQSYLRMLPVRIRFNTLKRGVMMLQRCFRLRQFNLQEEVEKANQRYPFRLRLHDIRLFVRINHSAAIAERLKEEKAGNVAGASAYNLNNFPGTYVNGYHIPFGLNPNRDFLQEVERLFGSLLKAQFLGEITSMGYDKLFYYPHHNHHVDVKVPSTNMTDVISAAEKVRTADKKPEHLVRVHKLHAKSADSSGHDEGMPAFFGASTTSMFTETTSVTAPTHVSHSSVDKANVEEISKILAHNYSENPPYCKTYKNITAFDRDSLFLTFSVHELPTINPKELNAPVDHRRLVQLLRIDTPLKPMGRPQPVKLTTLNKMGYKSVSNSMLMFLTANYKIATYSVAKPYFMVPYCRANTEVRVTISEVTDWPKSNMIGQMTCNVKSYVLRKRSFVANQAMRHAFSHLDIPTQDEGAKLNIVIKPDFDSMANTSAYMAKTASSIAGSMNAVISTRKDIKQEVVEGAFTWSVMCFGYSDFNDYGYVEVLYQESIQSTRKKCWCVLADRVFMIFNIVKENVKPRYSIDLRSAQVSVTHNEVIKIKTATDTQFFHFLTARDYEKWIKKLYCQSASHHAVAYHTYMKKHPFDHANYAAAPVVAGPLTAHVNSGFNDTGQAAVDTFVQNAMVTGASRSNSLSPTSFGATLGSRSGSPTNRFARTRSSMEMIDMLEFEVAHFLGQMKKDFIHLKAKDLIVKGELERDRETHKEYDKRHRNERKGLVVATHEILTHKVDYFDV